MRFRLVALIILLFVQAGIAQTNEDNTDNAISIPFFYGFYGYQWPGGDMAEQFGSNSVIGPGFMWKSPSNWLLGAEYSYIFGNNVKNGLDILQGIITSDGQIISGDGTPALVALFEQGNTVKLKGGKLFPVSKKDQNSGIFFTLGLGYINHKIRIDVENNSAPQLKGDYKRGYDRLSGGLLLSQSVGFMYFGSKRFLNFIISVEAIEGFTRAYRDYYFDLMAPPPDDKYFDFLIGPKITWMIPLRQRNVDKYYYY
jgi:hypothetical protein